MSQNLNTITADRVRTLQVREIYLSGNCLKIIAILKILTTCLDNPFDKKEAISETIYIKEQQETTKFPNEEVTSAKALSSQLAQWRCDNVVTTSWLTLSQHCGTVENESCGDVGPDVVTVLLSNIVKTLPQRCYNVDTTLSIWFLGHFITGNFDLFPAVETWQSYKSTWVLNPVFGKRDAPKLIRSFARFLCVNRIKWLSSVLK